MFIKPGNYYGRWYAPDGELRTESWRIVRRGRNLRHALPESITHERFDRLVVAAASRRSAGFHGGDIA